MISNLVNTLIKQLLLIFLVVLSSGCGDRIGQEPFEQAHAQQQVLPSQPEPRPFTTKEWRAAFESSFVASDVEEDGDGVTTYTACFGTTTNGKCNHVAFGKNDAFRKIDHLTPFSTQLNKIANASNYIGIYIAAMECKMPILLMSTSVNMKSDWVFIEKVAFMADNDVVIERSLPYDTVSRSHRNGWIHENARFIVEPNELDALEMFVSAKKRIIRVTGNKGYITLSNDDTDNFSNDAKGIMEILSSLKRALEVSGGPICDMSANATSNKP